MRTTQTIATLIAATLTLPAAHSQMAERWQKAAVQKHPSLATPGSPLNQRFLAIVAEKRASDPGFFQRADWPVRAADAAAEALRAEEAAAAVKAKAEGERMAAEKERAAEVAAMEREWEQQKAKWVFERLVFGDDEQTVVRKLNLSKLVAQRSPGNVRIALSSRYRWTIGERKFDLDFDMKPGLAAITLAPLPESTADLDSLVHGDWDALRAAAIERFGAPSKSTPFPTAAQLRRGDLTATDTWEQPTRTITLGVAEDGDKCQATLRIADPAREGKGAR